jgi:hypothetical protein
MKQCDNCNNNDKGENENYHLVHSVTLNVVVRNVSDGWEKVCLWEGELCEDCAPQWGCDAEGPGYQHLPPLSKSVEGQRRCRPSERTSSRARQGPATK